jgi:ACDE family multidrug resistance protein
MPEDKAGTRKVYKDHNLHVLFGVTLMAVLGVSSITPALPEIRDTFGVTSGQVGLLITVFTLPGVALTPVLGVLSDRHGRRKILVPALLLFGITGGLCAFARGFELLLALRLMQGMGAAALGTLNVTVIGDIFTGHERSAALGYNSSVLSVGTASFPCHRRRPRDPRVVLPLRPGLSRHPRRAPGPLLPPQPGAPQRPAPQGVLR